MSINATHTTRLELGIDLKTLPLNRDTNVNSSVTTPRTVLRSRRPEQLHELPLVFAGGNRSRLYLATRRTFDVIGMLVAMLLFAPIMIVSFVVLMVTTRGCPLFRQERIGFCGRPFMMYKFRTMSLNAESQRHLVKNERSGPVFKNRTDPRVTPFGRFLRSFSIDEMPQLFNVVRGDMSLVGPRPPIRSEVVQYKREQFERLSVNPGLICLWQVSGRAELDFEQQVDLDVTYVRSQSLWSDLLLLIRAPLSVLSRRGAY
jgi:lipopolysaccharide/colanic/teichoic acid biosynthesis glycosyltransferase